MKGINPIQFTGPFWRTQSYRSNTAFTLLELLVSMTILTGLIFLLFSMVDGTTKIWQRSEQRVDAFREARAALFIIARDLQSMLPAPDEVSTNLPASDPSYLQPDSLPDFKYFFVNPPTSGNTDVTFSGVATDTYADRLFFLTSQPENAQSASARGNMCLVGYYLDYTSAKLSSGQSEMTGAGNSFKLYRYFRDSSASFANLKSYAANPQTSTTLMQAVSASDEVLARNVVDFRVTAYDESMTEITPWDPKTTPHVIDISLTAYNYSVANTFSSQSDWMDKDSARNAPSRQSFSTRVWLPRSSPATPLP